MRAMARKADVPTARRQNLQAGKGVVGMGPPSGPSVTAWDRAARVPISTAAARPRDPPLSSRGGAGRRPAWNSETIRDASEYRLPPEEMLRRKALLQPKHHAFARKTTTTTIKKKTQQAYDPSKYTQQSAGVSVGSSAPSLASSPRCASRSESSSTRGTRAVKQQDQASIRTQEAVAVLEARLATLMLTQHDQPPLPSTDTTQLHKGGVGVEEDLMSQLTQLMTMVEHEAQQRQELCHRLERVEAALGALMTRQPKHHHSHHHHHSPSLHSSSGGSSASSEVLVGEEDEEEALRPCKRIEVSPVKACAVPRPHTHAGPAPMPPPRKPNTGLVGVWRPPSNKINQPTPHSE